MRLADGRELIYFDERDDVVRKAVDRRALPERSPGSRLRLDPLIGQWAAMATHRQTRTFLPPSDECPLCPSTSDRLTEIPASDYDVGASSSTTCCPRRPPAGSGRRADRAVGARGTWRGREGADPSPQRSTGVMVF
jgi:UDPglucose--hexose-1-phosphate uridylyltransferase